MMKNETKMTPRTDAQEWTETNRSNAVVLADFARTLERELAAERARLDWLDQRGYLVDKITHGASTPHPEDYWICTDGYRSGSAKTVRNAIDAAMKEETK